MTEPPRILYCRCAHAQVVPTEVRDAVLRQLCESGVAFESVADLCELSARRDPMLQRLAEGASLRVAACYPRAVQWLFAAAHAPLPADRTEVLNMRVLNAAEAAAAVLSPVLRPNLPARGSVPTPTLRGAGADAAVSASTAVGVGRAASAATTSGEWNPWFPVIDLDRCTDCMQCLSFCLFGVFGVDAQQHIRVENAENCKTNCPACSRVCPEAAIIFPKYKAGPINGDVVSDADLAREKMKIDISALLGGDIYSLLRERSERANSRFSKERDSDKALKERQKCLAKLVAAAEIPPEVLMSLPSPAEIQRRAAEAKARAHAALNPQA